MNALGVSCFNFQERLLPHVRAETARRLTLAGMKQNQIAQHLGVSQAMVSKYLRSGVDAPKGLPIDRIQNLVEEAVSRVRRAQEKGQVDAWCPICPQFSPLNQPTLVQECVRGDIPNADASRDVLENLGRAATHVRRAGFAQLAPEVNINLAMCLASAEDARGVAAFPGRLVEAKGEVRPVSDPEFGASNHLSQILLAIRRRQDALRAVICLRDGPDVRAAIQRAGIRRATLLRRSGQLRPPTGVQAEVWTDEGAFGIEPITYVFGATAVEAVDRAHSILEHLRPTRGRPQ